jgi:hypothetical protein
MLLTQAADLEEAPAWWVRPLDQLRLSSPRRMPHNRLSAVPSHCSDPDSQPDKRNLNARQKSRNGLGETAV